MATHSNDLTAPAAKAAKPAALKAANEARANSQDSAPDTTSSDRPEPVVEADALELLLRSPRLSVDTILRLLDISEQEFRNIIRANPDLGALLRQRTQGQLEVTESEPRQCKMCEEWFLPYAGDRYCSDECKTKARIERRGFREESCGCVNPRAHRGCH